MTTPEGEKPAEPLRERSAGELQKMISFLKSGWKTRRFAL